MTDSKHFRIRVDLSAFFFDHRRVARLFIKSNLKTIEDLKSRISDIFEISEFYLTAEGNFLPVSEDIRVLHDNETVCVIPKHPEKQVQSISKVSSSTVEPKKKHKKQKRSLEPIAEDSGETDIPKKKKSKKEYVCDNSDTSSSKEEAPRKKKKVENKKSDIPDNNIRKKGKHKHESVEPKSSDSSQSEASHHKEKNQSIVDKEVGSIEGAQKIMEIKKRLKQKTEDYITKHSKVSENVSANIKNVLPKLQSHIKNCDNSGRSTMSDIVRLSRHVDTPIKGFTKYTPPARITNEYLAKTKVNIVKIDVVKKESEQTKGCLSSVSVSSTGEEFNKNLEETKVPSESSDKSSISPPKNYVKEVIDSFEKSISPESKQSEEKRDNKMDTTEPKNDITNMKSSDQQDELNAFRNLVYNNPAYVPNYKNNAASDIQDTKSSPDVSKTFDNKLSLQTVDSTMLTDETESTNVSLDISSIPQNSFYESGNSINASVTSVNTSVNPNASIRSRASSSNRRYAGIGSLVELLRESDSVRSNESDTSSQYVTKRKRVRKHKRKSKKSNEGPEPTETKVIEPMNVPACPKMHIKFQDGAEDLTNKTDVDGDVNIKTVDVELPNIKTESPKYDDKATEHKKSNGTTFMETVVLSDENDDPIMENKFLFGRESIIKAPFMTNKLEPKVGDVIAFKVLKVSEDYTPQVSDYIVGKLVDYFLENKTGRFKILHGKDELLIPAGKLSLQEDTDFDSKESAYREFSWTELIAPKLLYP